NQGPWANMENYLRTLLPANELYIIAGGAGIGGTGSNGFKTTFANGYVTVPAQTWKVVLVIPKADGDDVSRVTCGTRTIAVIMPNTQGIRNNNWENYIVSVDQVETLTGYDFFSNLPDAVEQCVEAGTNGVNPPGTVGQSVTTNEDTAVAITLTAEGANNNPLTYTIVSGPTYGTLSGTGANQTYTPNINYFGPDSFTFKANDGTRDSNTSTVNITVNSVNDVPDAVDDGATVAEDSGANIVNIFVNDSDADGDTLIITAVTQGTNGSVVNNNGSVSYTPNANFFGTDTFSYTVSDGNGGTDTATATVTVTNVNDAPTAAGEAYSTNSNTALNVPARGVLTNDGDIDGDNLTAQLVSNVSNGSLTLNPDGSFTYTPNRDFAGADGFTYRASDGTATSNTVSVAITVNDTVAPVLTSSVAVNLLSTANSNLVNVGLSATARDNSSSPVVIQVQVFGDEDDEAATLPGVVHSPDARDIAPNTLRLRAERVEANDGRVYIIVVTATDAVGNVSRNYHTVVVPKNNKQSSINSVNAQAAQAVAAFQGANGAVPSGYFVIGDGAVVGPKQ
ncbi:MAG: tandem-95 repeat protein, partial [Blastocatellia bacterium]|nr:tandem-95 repeat protein [Blastocatellia bacterium]